MSTTGVISEPKRVVQVQGSCGHRWEMRTRVSNEKLNTTGNNLCPVCERQLRVKVVGYAGRRCAECNGPLHRLTPLVEDTCGPCDETRQAREAAERAMLLEDVRAAEREMVLRALPGSLPVICIASGVRWVDVQRVLREAERAGDVFEWNVPGFRTIYKLVSGLPDAQEQSPERNNVAKRPNRGGSKPRHSESEILAALPATATELTAVLKYQDASSVSARMKVMRRAGLVRAERVVRPRGGRENVWHRVEDDS